MMPIVIAIVIFVAFPFAVVLLGFLIGRMARYYIAALNWLIRNLFGDSRVP